MIYYLKTNIWEVRVHHLFRLNNKMFGSWQIVFRLLTLYCKLPVVVNIPDTENHSEIDREHSLHPF